ncbi:hypothetical protein V1514DRAFT_332466 [Lipomyces japonicus]|uniref:uncharacterized protein n=1 Tax=Lipomyces japonicus TaxID=56871 RepID=UPI0034CDAE39
MLRLRAIKQVKYFTKIFIYSTCCIIFTNSPARNVTLIYISQRSVSYLVYAINSGYLRKTTQML